MINTLLITILAFQLSCPVVGWIGIAIMTIQVMGWVFGISLAILMEVLR